MTLLMEMSEEQREIDSGASLLVSTSLLALKIQILILSVTMECDSEKPVFSLSWSSVLF